MSIPFDDKIAAITSYFGVSKAAALYMYLRKKRNTKEKTDPKYLKWDIKLQNALILADKCEGFNWNALEFGVEETELIKYNIIMDTQEVKVLYQKNMEGPLSKSKCEKVLNRIGFITNSRTRKSLRPSKSTDNVSIEIRNGFDVLGDMISGS